MIVDQHSYRVSIQSVPNSTPRPLWSVMIPTYNCAGYLREALASILAQDLGPGVMQIEVIDDHSTEDDPEAVVRELGASRIGFYRQPENVGHVRNFNTCLQRSQGRLVHLLHGDDAVRDGFYRKLQSAFEESPTVGAAFCRHIYMDQHGNWLEISPMEQPRSGILSNWLEKIAAGQRLTTPSIVVRREVYEKLGGFDNRIACYGEDWEMWVRIAAHYPVWFEVEPLAIYRVSSSGSLTDRSQRTGADTRDLRKATEIVHTYLPRYLPKKATDELSRKAKETYAYWALDIAREKLSAGEITAVIAQIREALKCHHSFKFTRQVAYLSLQTAVYWMRQKM